MMPEVNVPLVFLTASVPLLRLPAYGILVIIVFFNSLNVFIRAVSKSLLNLTSGLRQSQQVLQATDT